MYDFKLHGFMNTHVQTLRSKKLNSGNNWMFKFVYIKKHLKSKLQNYPLHGVTLFIMLKNEI